MRITIKKLKEFQAMSEASKKALRLRFDEAYEIFNNQYSTELRAISEYNFWNGYSYAMLKMIQFKKLKSTDENNPLNKLNELI